MRNLKLGLLLILIASPALADRKAADSCAAGLTADSAAIYNAAIGQIGPGKDNKAIVKSIAQDMVMSGALNTISARGAAQAAGQCLKKLKD